MGALKGERKKRKDYYFPILLLPLFPFLGVAVGEKSWAFVTLEVPCIVCRDPTSESHSLFCDSFFLCF